VGKLLELYVKVAQELIRVRFRSSTNMSSSSGFESVRPYSPAPPLEQDFIRQQIAKQQKGNFHSTSLKMVSSVNKTNLHPSGVQPQREHTEIEEELHEKAHIDYDRVAIVSCIEDFVSLYPS